MSEPILSGRYKILKKLGEGGFGQTFLAEDLHLPTKPHCVVKRLKSQFSDEESFKLAHRLFEQEADVLYRLGNHPSIPNLLAHFENDGEFFLVQEYVVGATLAQEFEAGKRYSEVEVVQFLHELLATLLYVHQQNVIHRDIKPANLIRRQADGRIFLIDFGAVKQVSAIVGNENTNCQSTITIGSQGFMPGEQMAGKPRFASDLYTVGLVAIEALTGIHPLKLKQHKTSGEFIWQHKVQLHPEVENFITKLVRYDFRQRYPSATEALASLNMIAANLGILKPSRVVAPVSQVPPQRVAPAVFMPQPVLTPSIITQTPYIPPTIISPPTRYFQPPKQTATKKGFFNWLRSNDLALSAFVAVLVLGTFFVGGYVLISRAVSNSEASRLNNTDKIMPDNPNQIFDRRSIGVFEEAITQAQEAEEKEEKATTKSEWQEIGNQYQRAYTLLAAVEPASDNYRAAQERIITYKQNAEHAFQQASVASATKVLDKSTTTTIPSETTSPTAYKYSTQTPMPAPPKVTMPPPRKEKMYISFNRSPYNVSDKVVSKVVTAVEGEFTASVGNSGAYSGSVTIRVNGGPDSCDVTFIAPHSERLQPGTYSGAQRYPFQSPTKPGLSFSGTGGCNTVAGSFTINNIIYAADGKSILLLYATFVHRCGETSPPTMGRVHYDARY